jgi:hypothetical protein
VSTDTSTPVKTGVRRIPTARGHRYTLDGVATPGVTTLIKQGVPAPALMYWAARSVAEFVADSEPGAIDVMRRTGRQAMIRALKGVPFAKRDNAAARGTEVHHYAELLIKGHNVDVPDHLTGYVQSAVDFMNEWRPAPVCVEAVVASRKWRYCGTVDLICDLPDGRRALMDYKTTGSGIHGETALQLAAYRHAEVFVNGEYELPLAELKIDCAYAVWLTPDKYEVIPVQTDEKVFAYFLHAAYVGRRADEMKAWIGEPETWKKDDK